MIDLDLFPGLTVDFDPTRTDGGHTRMAEAWRLCRDAVAGGVAVKAAGEKYLPKLSKAQDYEDYRDYRDRGFWFNATRRTVDAFAGLVFRKPPTVQVEDDREEVVRPILNRATRDGRDFEDLLTEVYREVLQTNRVGILEDRRPDDVLAKTVLEARPSYTTVYPASDILWVEVDEVNDERVPVLVVLREHWRVADSNDDLHRDEEVAIRLLYLEEDDGLIVYRAAVLRKPTGRGWIVTRVFTPLMNGKPMSRIPFWIVTQNGIDFEHVDTPVIYDLAELNMAHYRHSADYNRELHRVSVKTAIFPGWNIEEFGPPTIGGAIASPPGERPFILEATTTSPINEEMRRLEERMSALGAQLLSRQARYVEAEGTAQIHARGESSVVAQIARAVGEAMSEVFTFKMQWSSIDRWVTVTLNTDFDEGPLDPQTLQQLVQSYTLGAISFDTLYHSLRRGELYPPDWSKDDEAMALEVQSAGLGPDSGTDVRSMLEEIRLAVAELRSAGE